MLHSFCRRNWNAARDLLAVAGALLACMAASAQSAPAQQTVLPSGVSETWWQTVQENIAASEYEISWQDTPAEDPAAGAKSIAEAQAKGAAARSRANIPACFQAPNRAQNLRTYFTDHGPYMTRRTEDGPQWQVGIELQGIGTSKPAKNAPKDTRPKNAHGVYHAPRLKNKDVDKSRINYHRDGGITEWYENKPEGLKQNFQIEYQPAAGDDVVLDLAVRGDLLPVAVENGNAIEFTDTNGVSTFRYDGLKAQDKDGKALAGALSVLEDNATIRITIDITGAIFPVTIDPLISTTQWTRTDPDATSRFGASISLGGDINRDGYNDAAFGAPTYGSTDRGRVFIFLGGPGGMSTTPQKVIDGVQDDAHFGKSVNLDGDVDGDGYVDLVVGVDLFNNTATYQDEGQIQVYRGSVNGFSTTPDWTSAPINQANARLGFTVAVGDTNRDGKSDIAAAAYSLARAGYTQEGAVFVWLGASNMPTTSSNWQLYGQRNKSWLGGGEGLKIADINTDGIGDLIVGAPTDESDVNQPGDVYVFFGSDPTGLSTAARGVNDPSWKPDWSKKGTINLDQGFGTQVAVADINGNGTSDLVITSRDYQNTENAEGAIHVYYDATISGPPSSPSLTLQSNRPLAQFGTGLVAGDLNGDGFDDLAVYSIDQSNGRVSVYLGASAGLKTTPAWEVSGSSASNFLGYEMEMGDVNGDGYFDLGVANSNGASVTIYYGGAAGPGNRADWAALGGQATAQFGATAKGGGDFNGDGYDDILVSAPHFSNGDGTEGRVVAYYGAASGLETSPSWSFKSDQTASPIDVSFGNTDIAILGDINNDGKDDCAIAARRYDAGGETDEGRVWVVLGSATGLSTVTASYWTAESNQANALFGAGICGGNFNGDQYMDMAVSAPLYTKNFSQEGAVFVYYGSANGFKKADSSRTSGTPANADWDAYAGVAGTNDFGNDGMSSGDANNDGYDDLLINASQIDTSGLTNNGAAFMWLGSNNGLAGSGGRKPGSQSNADWKVYGNQDGERLDQGVFLGDINGDHYEDWTVGSWNYSNGQTSEGMIDLYKGGTTLSTTPAWHYEPNIDNARFSYSGNVGDLNNDGFADLIIAADGGSVSAYYQKGRAYIFTGSPSGFSNAPSVTIDGPEALANFAAYPSTAGDVNGDGYLDILLKADSYSAGLNKQGAVYVYYGPLLGPTATPQWTQSGGLDRAYGRSVANAGDVNGDAYDDLLVGDPLFDSSSQNAGKVFLYLGGRGGLAMQAAWSIQGDTSNAQLGYSVAGGGDINRDGADDILITELNYAGQPSQTQDLGRVLVFYGHEQPQAVLFDTPDVLLSGAGTANAAFGYGLAIGGDINGDGVDDVVVGEPNSFNEDGRAYVYYGKTTQGLFTSPSQTLLPTESLSLFGASVAIAPDVNGDQKAEVLIGAVHSETYSHGGGITRVFYGKSTGTVSFGGDCSCGVLTVSGGDWQAGGNGFGDEHFGFSVAGLGDVNGDGYGDIAIGGQRSQDPTAPVTTQGMVAVYFGNPSGLGSNNRTPDKRLYGDAVNQKLGAQVGAVGDVNADGFNDMLVGASGYSNGQTDEGQVRLWYGGPGGFSTQANWMVEGGTPNLEYGGYSNPPVLAGGDVNGDRVPDIFVGCGTQDEFTGTLVTRVDVYYGGPPLPSATVVRYNAASDAGAVNYGNVLRATLDYGAGTASRDVLTMFRKAPANLPAGATQNVLPVHWRLVTNRTGITGANALTVTLGYTDFERGTIPKANLSVYKFKKPTDTAWTAVTTSTTTAQNQARNEIVLTGLTDADFDVDLNSGLKTLYFVISDKDTISPTAGTITSNDFPYTTNRTQITINWSGFSDSGSGLSYYEVAFGTEANPEEYLTFAAGGHLGSEIATKTFLAADFPGAQGDAPPANGFKFGKYVCSVRATDKEGNTMATAVTKLIEVTSLDTVRMGGMVPVPPGATVSGSSIISGSQYVEKIASAENGLGGFFVVDYGVGASFQITWNGGVGTKQYLAVAEPVHDAVHMYHTDRTDGGKFPSPTVDLSGVDLVNFHYNSHITDFTGTGTTLDPKINYLWIEPATGQLHALQGTTAKPNVGEILIHFEEQTASGTKFKGAQVVDVRPYAPDTSPNPVLQFDIGDELHPISLDKDSPFLAKPYIARNGDGTTDNAFMYQHDVPGAKDEGALFAVRRTSNLSYRDAEVFWMRTTSANNVLDSHASGNIAPDPWNSGLKDLGLVWPFEMARYSFTWPTSDGKIQYYVRDKNDANVGTDVKMDGTLNPVVMPYLDDLAPYQVSENPSSGHFATTADSPLQANSSAALQGWLLMRYRPGSDVQFVVVRCVDRETKGALTALRNWQIGNPVRDLDDPTSTTTAVPGYIHVRQAMATKEDRYDWEVYDGKLGETQTIFDDVTGQIVPVNTGNLEVWWYEKDDSNVTAWPYKVQRFVAGWSTTKTPINLSDSKGTGDTPLLVGTKLYYQNDPTKPGFNPNDEHAALLPQESPTFGRVAAFALRDDLEVSGIANTSKPYVIVKNLVSGAWKYDVYPVVTGNLTLNSVAGERINPPYPLRRYETFPYVGRYPVDNSASPVEATAKGSYGVPGTGGPHWQDRTGRHWAKANGAVTMRFYYQIPADLGFYLANLTPTAENRLPWLAKEPSAPGGNEPINVTYNVTWPNVPKMELGDVLVKQKSSAGQQDAENANYPGGRNTEGLPAVEGQISAEVIFQESPGKSAMLIDYKKARSIDLDDPAYASMSNKLPSGLATESLEGNTYFTKLPPGLRERLYFDPVLHTLNFKGIYVEPTAAPGSYPYYILPNIMSDNDKDKLKGILTTADGAAPADVTNWGKLIDDLKLAAKDPIEVLNSDPKYVGLALTTGGTKQAGYVTVAMQNDKVADPLPVSLEIIKVTNEYQPGAIAVIEPLNPFDERLVLQHEGDFEGHPENYSFRWYMADVTGANPPQNEAGDPLYPDSSDPLASALWYTADNLANQIGTLNTHGNGGYDGRNQIKLEGAGVDTLKDHWVICRYVPNTATSFPVDNPNTTVNESRWTSVAFAPGWIKRVVGRINPFTQRAEGGGIEGAENRFTSFGTHEINNIVNMISQAGERWRGNVPLNTINIDDLGLIEIYETVLGRGRELSIDASTPVDDPVVNNALLLAAGRIADLYTLLGNEAYADAADPTIGFGTDDGKFGNEASSIFCFMNQVPTLMDEELALLRGRDDSMQPAVTTSPVYNRLIWNFTNDLNGGEVAYALNYNIHDQADSDGKVNGTIDEADAKKLYPQGHGDAWGHYLSAMSAYYKLLQDNNFSWLPRAEAWDVGGVPVSVDYLDERKFAVVAAAKARTGAEIVNLTYRDRYVEDVNQQWQGYSDPQDDGVYTVGTVTVTNGSTAVTGSGTKWTSVVGRTFSIGGTDYAISRVNSDTSITLSSNYTGTTGPGKTYSIVRSSVQKQKWGVADWASRAGQGAYFDWLVGNAILEANDDNDAPIHTGVEKIDRTTVTTLHEIADNYFDIEKQMDNADIGLSPLGLANNVIPFGISKAGIDQGQTHFEQVYALAVTAMNNALTVFDHANSSTQVLRAQNDKVENFQQGIRDKEADFTNRLIEVFGYPYSDDIGGGKTYPQDYNGPDLYHYMLSDPSDLSGDEALPTQPFEVTFRDVDVDATGAIVATDKTVDYFVPSEGFGMIRPSDWSGRRKAPGEIQLAQADLYQARGRFERALQDYNNLVEQVERQADLLQAQYALNRDEIQILNETHNTQISLNNQIFAVRSVQQVLRTAARQFSLLGEAVSEAPPHSTGVSSDMTSAIRAALKKTFSNFTEIANTTADSLSLTELGFSQTKESVSSLSNIRVTTARDDYAIEQSIAGLTQLVRSETSSRLDLYTQLEALKQASGRYLSSLARGERLISDRLRFRQETAAQTQDFRYKDMAFRVFRNDALQKYRAQFDLAARYVYLAAKAYDYETGLLDTDTMAGQQFLTNIVRSRAIGMIQNGQPVTGGDNPTLADAMGRMWLNFNLVLRGQLGFNNPQTETDRFSLRSELFRLLPGSSGDTVWRSKLAGYVVPNILDVPEVKRFCLMPSPVANAEPGIVIPFDTNVNFKMNFFGWPLGGGDSAYDSSNFATKIRAVGVWFSNYNNLGEGMSNTPRVYLVPVGSDYLRSPSGDGSKTREFRVVDQVLPTPFPIGPADIGGPGWIPTIDTQSGPFEAIRKYPSFRAYHDSGTMNPSELASDSRLIGRSVWNSRWLLVIPGGTLNADGLEGIARFIYGPYVSGTSGPRTNQGVSDIKLFFQTYAYSGNTANKAVDSESKVADIAGAVPVLDIKDAGQAQ